MALKLRKRGKQIACSGKNKRNLQGMFEIRNTPGDLINTTTVKIRLKSVAP